MTSLEIKSKYLLPVGHPNRVGRKLLEKRALVIHYTANYKKSADAIANAKYFGRDYKVVDNKYVETHGKPFSYGSTHYIVDQHNIIQCLSEDEEAIHVGSSSGAYTPLAKEKFMTPDGKCRPNAYTIGIEMCVNEGNDWNKTVERTIEISADIMIRHNISINNLIRHYDVTWKVCPKMYVDDPKAWQDFKVRVAKRITERKEELGMSDMQGKVKIVASLLNLRQTPDTSLNPITQIPNGTIVDVIGVASNGWYKVRYGNYVGYVSNKNSYVQVVEPIKPVEHLIKDKLMFKDLVNDKGQFHWATKYIEYFGRNGILDGDGQGFFYPENPMTRAQGVAVICKALIKLGLIKESEVDKVMDSIKTLPEESKPSPVPESPSIEFPTATLRKGDKGEQVKLLQKVLNSYGYNLDVDGSYGSKTEKAVKEFQTVFGLEVDGICGSKTRNALKNTKGYRKFRMYGSTVHVYETSSNEFVDVELGVKGKLEKLSKITKAGKNVIAKINGGFFYSSSTGVSEHLGLYVDEGVLHNQANQWLNMLYYKDGHTEIKNASTDEINRIKDKLHWGISTSYTLMKDGTIDIVATTSDMQSLSKQRHPRTFLGHKKDGTFVLFVVDGRRTDEKGITAQEQAEIARMCGCYNAINLDGGGSSEMIVNDKIMNRPSDGVERSVGSALLVYKV